MKPNIYINLYFTHMDNTEDLSEEKINLKIAAGEGDGYASATLNAKTGELISFQAIFGEFKADE